MHYKIKYKDPQGKSHSRYYAALDHKTATEMFKATVSHSIKEPVEILDIYKMTDKRWEPAKN